LRPHLLSLFVALATGPWAAAQAPASDLLLAPKPPEAAPAAEAGTDAATKPVFTGWDDGFILRSPDNRFSLRITGQIQTDYRGYLDARDQTDFSTFSVRRARLGIEASVAEIYEFRLLPDFGQGQSRIQDSYLNVHVRDAFQFEIGKFKQPFSYEQLIQDRFVPTMERSLLDLLVPARDVGLMIHGQKLFEDRLDYGVSISDGQQNGDGDLSNGPDLNARMAVRPLAASDSLPALRLLQLGMAVSVGGEFELVGGGPFRTPAFVPWFRFLPGTAADGLRVRYSPEVVYFVRGFGCAAQYLRMEQQFRAAAAGATDVNLPFDAFYVLATWLLTGEERTTYSKAIAPLRPFDLKAPLASPGAWEIVARVSRLTVGDTAFAPGANQLANPAVSSPGATELTFGFNWYLNKWVRTQFNWEHAWFDRPVLLGPAPPGLLRTQNTLMARLQVIF
jgi:phosphate-selective porin OprO and OprP